MSLLRCEGLARRPWIDGFDLEVAAGEAVCLRAPSGSGKTLLLRALADLDPRDGGRVWLDGVDLDTFSGAAWRRAVRYVPQSPPRRPGCIADAVTEASELLGITVSAPADLPLERDMAALSGGEAQRLALALALGAGRGGAPRVLLLDEPTASLDADRTEEVIAVLQAQLEAGQAIVAATHDERFVERLGAREVRLA